MKGNEGSLSVDQERVVVVVGRVGEWESGREGGLGPEGMGKIRGICRQHMPRHSLLCENGSAARGSESAFIGHLLLPPSRGMGASAQSSQPGQLCLRWETRVLLSMKSHS